MRPEQSRARFRHVGSFPKLLCFQKLAHFETRLIYGSAETFSLYQERGTREVGISWYEQVSSDINYCALET